MRQILLSIGLCLAASISVLVGVGRADTVQLTNGDTLSGEVLSLDAKQLKIKSQVLGEVAVPRSSVQSIVLGTGAATGNSTVRPAAPAAGKPPAAGSSTMSIQDLLKQLGAGGAGAGSANPGDLVKQLQAGGVPAAELDKLKKEYPLLASPAVQNYFNKTVGGLLNGSLSINDIRNEAIRARDETRAAIKDLGPEAEQALAGYLGILDRFIQETEPTPAAPASTPPSVKKP